MPDLKEKLDRLLSDAADCQLIGSLAADPVKRADFRHRADQFRAVAEAVRAQISSRRRPEIEFLESRAVQCRSLAADIADAAMRDDLLALAAELELTAKRERGEH